MKTILERREFLSALPCALLLSEAVGAFGQKTESQTNDKTCWLDVCAPFIIDDIDLGIRSEIILTSDTFVGRRGHEDGADETEYEIYLFDADGNAVGPNGVAKSLVVPAMHTTVIPVRELIGDRRNFFGGLKVRLRPRSRTPMHATDLFSSAFVRWTSDQSFDNVHANPDPIQVQRPDPFFYSMPFPPLREYECLFSLFNPYKDRSSGNLTLYDSLGNRLKNFSYDLKPGSSLLLDLRKGELVKDLRAAERANDADTPTGSKNLTNEGGTVAVTNKSGTVKNFGYLMIKRPGTKRFSIEHPIHQSPYDPLPPNVPIDASGRFKAKNILYTPLVFNSKRIGGITLDSRFHLSSGAPMEQFLWLSPFVVDKDGNVPWQLTKDAGLKGMVPAKQIDSGVLKLGGQHSCVIDSSKLGLPENFSGGLSLAIAPATNHTLMKVELRIAEWGAHAFTHFRPGLAAARAYQKAPQRGGLATDYITCGSRIETRDGRVTRDEIICLINIDDKGIEGAPELEIFTSAGLLTKVRPGIVPAFGCTHYLLSELVGASVSERNLSIRLVDENTTILMSVIHVDYICRDIGMDHVSDGFFTFQDFNCKLESGKY